MSLKVSWISFLVAATGIVACSPQTPPPASRSAQFADYPAPLFDTFEISCEGPGDRFSKPGRTSFECRSTLPPDLTAYLILNYDGYTQDLPKGVRRMSSSRTDAGFQVDAELYFLVPRKDAPPLKVPVESTELDQELTRLFLYFGGTPM